MDLKALAQAHRSAFPEVRGSTDRNSAVVVGSIGGQKLVQLPGGRLVRAGQATTGAIAGGGLTAIRGERGKLDALRSQRPRQTISEIVVPKFDSLDVYLLQDISGSFTQSLPIARDLFASISGEQVINLKSAARARSVRWGLGVYSDRYDHRVAMTADAQQISDAYARESTYGGHEQQLDRLYVASQNQAISFSVKALKTIVLITDETDDSNYYNGLGPRLPELRGILEEKKISPVFLIEESVYPFWVPISEALGGVITQFETSDPSNLIEAIADSVRQL